MRAYYKKLHLSKLSNVSEFKKKLRESNIKTLADTNKSICEGFVSQSEAKHVLKNMKNGGTPTSDAFSAVLQILLE